MESKTGPIQASAPELAAGVRPVLFLPQSLSPGAPSHTCAAWLQWTEPFTLAGRAAAVNYFKAARRVMDKISCGEGRSRVRDSSGLTVKTTWRQQRPLHLQKGLLFFLLCQLTMHAAFALMATVSDSYRYFFCTSDGLSSWLIISDPSHWAIPFSLIKSLHLVLNMQQI